MWVRGQGRSIVNFDYVTQVEARVMEASFTTADREPKYEIIAYRRPPAADAILLSMLDGKTAAAVVDRLAGAIMAEATMVEIMDLLEEVRYAAAKSVEQAATVSAEAVAEAAATP